MKHLKLLVIMALYLFSFTASGLCEEAKKDDYLVGVDDILEIAVLQPEKMLTAVTVAPGGSITFPYIGNVMVKGMTLGAIQEEIQKRLADGYMKYPVVAVSLKESLSRKFSVYGQVSKPGSYPIEDKLTVLKAISMAGGFTSPGSSGRVKVLRLSDDGTRYKTIESDIASITEGSAKKANIIIQPGDTIMVYEDKFFVYGEVMRPGAYPLENNTTVLKAVSTAGGFTSPGSSGRVEVLRLSDDGTKYKTIDVDINSITSGSGKEANIPIKAGDTVVVYADKFFVYGEVMRPGAYPLESNTTILKAISISGGFTKFGSSSRVKVLKPRKKGPGYETIKVNIKAIMEGNAKEDIILQPGDIVVISEGIF